METKTPSSPIPSSEHFGQITIPFYATLVSGEGKEVLVPIELLSVSRSEEVLGLLSDYLCKIDVTLSSLEYPLVAKELLSPHSDEKGGLKGLVLPPKHSVVEGGKIIGNIEAVISLATKHALYVRDFNRDAIKRGGKGLLLDCNDVYGDDEKLGLTETEKRLVDDLSDSVLLGLSCLSYSMGLSRTKKLCLKKLANEVHKCDGYQGIQERFNLEDDLSAEEKKRRDTILGVFGSPPHPNDRKPKREWL